MMSKIKNIFATILLSIIFLGFPECDVDDDSYNQRPKWKTPPVDVTLLSGETYNAVNGIAVDRDGSSSDLGYLKCKSSKNTCSFPIDVTGEGGGEVFCNMSFSAEIIEACEIKVVAVDGMGGSVGRTININVNGKIYYVDWIGEDDIGCRSWADACETVQGAMDLASDGDVIFVRETPLALLSVTYKSESTDPVVVMKPGVKMYGGFFGNESSLADRGNPALRKTILDGDFESEHVVIGASNAVLDGFSIRRGYAGAGAVNPVGAGMLNLNASNIEINNCSFYDNFAYVAGGGMYNYASSPIIGSSFFGYNGRYYDSTGGYYLFTYAGGGMSNNNSSPVISDSVFTYNSTAFAEGMGCYYCAGGGMFNLNSNTSIDNTSFYLNFLYVYAYGAAIYSDNSYMTVSDSSFVFNMAREYGYGGALFNRDSTVVISNSVFDENVGTYGAAMYNNYSDLTLDDSNFIFNLAAVGGGMFNHNYTSSTISNCVFDSNQGNYFFGEADYYRGGGIYNHYSTADIDNSVFTGGGSYHSGGGMFNLYADVYVTNTDFTENCSGWVGGGGMYNGASNAVISNCVFNDNVGNLGFFITASGGGGGMFNIYSTIDIDESEINGNYGGFLGGGGLLNWLSTVTISNSVIEGNSAASNSYGGGAIYSLGGYLNMENNMITSNNAVGEIPFTFLPIASGGALNLKAATVDINNCTIAENYAVKMGGAIYSLAGSGVISNSVIWGNTAWAYPEIIAYPADLNISYSVVRGGYSGPGAGAGIISGDPLFINFFSFPVLTIYGDYVDRIDVDLNASLFSIGDVIEIANDGVPRTVTGISGYPPPYYVYPYYVSFTPPLDNPSYMGMFISNWLPGAVDLDENLHLSQAPDQGVTSPAVDTGSGPVITGSTSTAGSQDTGTVDMGFHYPIP